jgi:type I restriction enzyme S subunit
MNENIKLPDGWKLVKLGEVAKITTGNSNVEDASDDGVYPFFDRSGEIKRSKKYFLNAEAVIVPGEGSDFIPKYFKGKFDLHQRTYAIFDFSGLDGKFFYYLMHLLRRDLIRTAVGTTVLSLRLPHFQNLEFPISPLAEQRKIAENLETIDNAIEKTDAIIEKYKRIKQGLMQDLLTNGIDENWQIRNEKTHKFKDSPLGRIPEEWEVVRLGEISFLKGRIGWQGLTTQEYLEDGKYYLITGVNFENGKIKWESCFYVSEKRYNMDRNIQLKLEDVLVTKDGTIGKIAYVDKLPKKATLGTGVFVVRTINNSYYPKYLYYVLTSFIFDRFIDNLKAGSTINHLYQKDFVLFKIPLPPLPEQERIATVLSQIDETIEKEQAYKEKLEGIKKGLMEDLLTGKVRVNHLIEEETKDEIG